MEGDEDFTFDADLARARTIPARWYYDPDVLEREQARVFARAWQLVGRTVQAAAPGDYLTCRVGREPVLVVRDGVGPCGPCPTSAGTGRGPWPRAPATVPPSNAATTAPDEPGRPAGPREDADAFEWYVLEPLDGGRKAEFERSFALSEQVQREDMAICAAVQEGLRSATYRQGRYSVLRENGVHHFHGLLSRFLL